MLFDAYMIAQTCFSEENQNMHHISLIFTYHVDVTSKYSFTMLSFYNCLDMFGHVFMYEDGIVHNGIHTEGRYTYNKSYLNIFIVYLH